MIVDWTGVMPAVTTKFTAQDELDLNIPFNSDTFKTILNFNKDMEEGKLYLSNMGLMKLEFKTDDIVSEYFLIRKAETSY